MVLYREAAALVRLRPTLRTQLTLLYGGLLAALGVGLLFLLVPLQGSSSVQAGPHAAAIAAALNTAERGEQPAVEQGELGAQGRPQPGQRGRLAVDEHHSAPIR